MILFFILFASKFETQSKFSWLEKKKERKKERKKKTGNRRKRKAKARNGGPRKHASRERVKKNRKKNEWQRWVWWSCWWRRCTSSLSVVVYVHTMLKAHHNDLKLEAKRGKVSADMVHIVTKWQIAHKTYTGLYETFLQDSWIFCFSQWLVFHYSFHSAGFNPKWIRVFFSVCLL